MPFTAKVITESTQTLVDGNRIIQKSEVLIARDSEGRTRRDQKLAGTGASIIFIHDPVAGISSILDTRSASVRKIPFQKADAVTPPVSTGASGESLGTQLIEGLPAEGTRLRHTIPPDKAGSDRSIEVLSEFWYSAQLQTVVLSRTVDPRLGDISYKLTDIQLVEPAPSLFEVPKE